MIRNTAALRQRIESLTIGDPAAALTFTMRLAREQRWSLSYAERVVGEYKRFLVLAATGTTPVTPSDAVDEAWHLHLTYTRSYWDDLCRDTLGRPLHHDPTSGGAGEQRKFVDWYTRTLESYAHTFGEEPPTDIWPPPHRRFQVPASKRPAPKKRMRRWATGIAVAACAAGALYIGPSAWAQAQNVGIDERNRQLFFIFLIVVVAIIVFFVLLRFRGGGGSCSAGGCGFSGCGGGCGSGCGGGCGGS